MNIKLEQRECQAKLIINRTVLMMVDIFFKLQRIVGIYIVTH